jgi:organic hydroperoxide reductase OsmC/OhrA
MVETGDKNMMPFPHRYTVTLSNRTLQAPPREPIALGPPPQFGGSDRVWSPEELLIGATLECLWTTFEALARRSGLAIHDFTGAGIGILDRGSPVPAFTAIELNVHVRVDAGEEQRARTLLAKAEQACIISHALNVPVKLDATATATSMLDAAG